jgi:hypothetical protein
VEGCGDFRSRLRGCYSQDFICDSQDKVRAWGGNTVTGALQGGACDDDGGDGDGAADDDCRLLG